MMSLTGTEMKLVEVEQKSVSHSAVSYTHLDVYKRQVCVCVSVYVLIFLALSSFTARNRIGCLATGRIDMWSVIKLFV